MLCRHCSKECKNKKALVQHEIRCSSNPKRIPAQRGMLGKKGSNQFIKAKSLGLEITHSADTRAKLSESAKNQFWSCERRKRMSEVAKSRNLGGHTSKKQIHYQLKNGEVVYLQSSYEIRFAVLLDLLDIDWSRPDPFIWIDPDGEYHRYYPDFKVGNIYFDTKNDYLAVKDLPKIEAVRQQNKIDLRIVTKEQINVEYLLTCQNG